MEVNLDQHLEAQLNELAMKTGRGTEELVQQAVSRMLEYDTGFLLQT
jgi:predicted transcriptional regulator